MGTALVPSEQLNTRIGSVLPQTPAATANLPKGDKIVAVDGHEVQTWEEINYRFSRIMGETGLVSLALQSSSKAEGWKARPMTDLQK